IDIFRIFDALNDTRNLEAAIKAVKKHGGHAQGTLCYTISPAHTVEKFISYAKEQAALGIDSLCIKDMAGILSPITAERLVQGLVDELNIPIQLHCHSTSGMAVASYVEGVRAGAGAIDCAISSMSGFSSQPPVETMAAIFSETNYSAGLDLEALDRIAKYFEELAPKRGYGSVSGHYIDRGILMHQIPGGMISNFRSQLSMQQALDKLPEVLDEVARVRKDLGFPPLVTPTSQIVGTQAVMNVLAGERYKIVPNEVKDYVRGNYGSLPSPISKAFVRKILGSEKPIGHRPADALSPMLPNAADGVDPKFIEREEDILSYVLLPEPALQYFMWRAMPPDQRPETPADLELKKMSAEKEKPAPAPGRKESGAEAPAAPPPQPPANIVPDIAMELLEKIDGLALEELVFSKGSFTIAVRPSGSPPARAAAVINPATPDVAPRPQPSTPPPPDKAPAAPKDAPPVSPSAYAMTIDAPFVGVFYLSPGPGKPHFVKEGDTVDAGSKLCIVEAMKLFNEITAPKRCRILKILATEGQAVEKGQPIFGIDEA
ncbi:MAG TPA: pyruvate carboxylase subunit B, partial [Acidobacteriota bacterium]|nr:pyruvate carboxylase subunit B [Acidobacteriota bacterium]